MKQPLFTRQEFYKSSVRHHRFYFCFVYRSDFRNRNNSFNPGYCFIQALFGRTEDAYFTLVTHFFQINGSAGFSLYFLNYFTTGSDYCTNKFLINE